MRPEAWKEIEGDGAAAGRSYTMDLQECLAPVMRRLDLLLDGDMKEGYKMYLRYRCEMSKKVTRVLQGQPSEIIEPRPVTVSGVDWDRSWRPEIIRKKEDVKDATQEMIQRIIKGIEARTENTSGLEWDKSLGMTIHVNKMVGMEIRRWKRGVQRFVA